MTTQEFLARPQKGVSANHCAISPAPPRRRPLRFLATLAILTAISVGCSNGASTELVGQWVGRPDDAAKRRDREDAKYSDLIASANANESSASTGDTAADPDSEKESATDWEQYDVVVRMTFKSDRSVDMSLGEGSQPIAATWEIIDSGPAGIVLELVTPEPGATSPESAGDPAVSASIRRRFELQPDRRDGVLVGFALSELGADRLLGSLYFTRPGGE